MRMHIRIRFDVLGTSARGVVIPRGSAGTALAEGAVSPGSLMMRMVRMMVVVGIMSAPVMHFLCDGRGGGGGTWSTDISA